ncbi:hypothetical protein N431DRAFT_117462 [Stipitochalara longipes BDJ]|nr:hypothetical protein N431DRAFT_117462 [Stipitochalara longipes BDJ]
MAPTAKFFLPDDEEGYSSENREPTMMSSNEAPRSLLVENFHKHPNTETEIFPPFIERMPEPTKVIKGFTPAVPLEPVEPKPANDKTYEPVPLRPCFPPPTNESYYLTTEGHDPKFLRDKARVITTMPSRRKLTGIVNTIKPSGKLVEVAENHARHRNSLSDTSTPNRSREGTATSPEPFTEGYKPAVIDDYAKTSVQGGPLRRDGPHLLIPPVKQGTMAEPILDYCKKCGKNHIPPGSPITLPDRDTCGAYLPDWFPSHNYKQPWDNFRGLYNKIVLCEEAERGFRHSAVRQSPQTIWDKEYHDEHPKWAVIGRRMGWWKCGTGTEVERSCGLCHKPKPAEETAIDPENAGTVRDQRKYLEKWVEDHMKAIGLNDKAFAEEMIHRMKPQEVLGYFADYRVLSQELEGYDSGNDSDPDGEKEVPLRPNLKPKGFPSVTPSTLNLSERDGCSEKSSEMSDKEENFTPTGSSGSEGLTMRAGKPYFAK